MARKKQITTLVNFILDKSGSMSSVWDSTISGFNEYVNSLKNQKGKFLFSLTLFDTDSIEKRYIAVPLSKVEPLTRENYRPGSMTPLYDAVVKTVEEVHSEIKDKKDVAVVTVIMTDGEENSSREHDEKCLQELVRELEAKGNWTFTFLGANQDAWATAQRFGISQGNVLAWQSTDKGTKDAFDTLTRGTVMYASAMSMSLDDDNLQTKNFFNQSDKGGDTDAS